MGAIQEIEAVRHRAGLWIRDGWTVYRFSGADAASWLHNQTTNDVEGLENGHGNTQALVNRQGRLQSVFHLFRFEDEYWAILHQSQVAALLDRVETHLFMEQVEVEEVGAESAQILIEGPRALLFLNALLDPKPDVGESPYPSDPDTFAPVRLMDHDVLAFRMTETGEDGYLLLAAPGEGAELYDKLAAYGVEHGVAEISEPARNALLLESGGPRPGVDYDPDTVIAETPFEATAVNYSKGCYLGQEVVARLKAYGSPKQALVGLTSEKESADFPPVGSALFIEGKRIGRLCGYAWSPTLTAWAVRVYLDRKHRTQDSEVTLGGEDGKQVFTARVRHLPLYETRSREAYAEHLYHEALERFEADADDVDDSAIGLLDDALHLAPEFEDAYEALGVILHRHGQVDEAITWMKRLAAMNPNCVMAHTNLSVFYVAKGMIQEAEDEKALAEQLEFQREMDAKQAATHAKAERERIKAEANERIGMFLEVLEIDPEDPIATMGLGTAYMQLEQYPDAIPHLETATRVQADYSAAYLNLGKCLEFTGDTTRASDAYQQGIEAAGRKGDLMPMREMERRLKALG